LGDGAGICPEERFPGPHRGALRVLSLCINSHHQTADGSFPCRQFNSNHGPLLAPTSPQGGLLVVCTRGGFPLSPHVSRRRPLHAPGRLAGPYTSVACINSYLTEVWMETERCPIGPLYALPMDGNCFLDGDAPRSGTVLLSCRRPPRDSLLTPVGIRF
jgi:hypothetical protein